MQKENYLSPNFNKNLLNKTIFSGGSPISSDEDKFIFEENKHYEEESKAKTQTFVVENKVNFE